MKKILVYGMTDNRGGIEAYIMNYFRLLVKKQIIFDFVTEHERIAYADEIESLGGKIYNIPSRRAGLFKHMSSIRDILKNHKEYDTVYFNVLSASEVFTVLGAASIKGVKKIVHSHNNAVKTMGRHRVLRPLLNLLTDVKLACSGEAAEFMFGDKSLRRNEVEVIFNAIDVEKYQYNSAVREAVRRELNLSFENFVVGHVGRMCYQKNSLFVIELFYHVYQRNKNAILVLVGDGEDREQVKQAIKQYGIEKNVLMLGMRSDVEKLMQAMDVFLLPSRFEGLPVVLIEAQAAGLHCICSNQFTNKSNITGNVEFISLNESIEYWVTAILNSCGKERKDEKDAVTKAGFNINYEVGKLEKILKENNV